MKPTAKRLLIALIFELFSTINPIIIDIIDPHSATTYFIFPNFLEGWVQRAFWYCIVPVLILVCVLLGFLLGTLITRFYVKFNKSKKDMLYIGFAKFHEENSDARKRILSRVIIGVFLCLNIWLLLFEYNVFEFWVKPEHLGGMYTSDGRMNQFPMGPWYWLPPTVTSILFAICFVIMDSGLVYAKKVPQHPNFSDTQRIGDFFWNLVKGYAGVMIILSFIEILLTPLGRELSLLLYPALAAAHTFFAIILSDHLMPWGRALVFNAFKKESRPEFIDLDYKVEPVSDPKDLVE
ncbi:MAG: hypothetical protein ACFFCS_24285 [Candidatus Hodarchaeota archaeon]